MGLGLCSRVAVCWALVAAVLTPQLSLLSCTWWQVAGVIVGQSGGSAGLRPQAIGQSKASLSFRGSCAESLCPVFVVFLNYFWLCWISVALWYFSSCSKQGALLSSCGPLASRGGFSCGGAQVLGHVSSAVAAPGLSSYGTQAQLPCSMWDLPRPRIKHVSPALAGRFFTPELPGKPCVQF